MAQYLALGVLLCLSLSLAKHLRHINPPMTEELGMANGKTPIGLKDDCWTRTTWLYVKYWFITKIFTCHLQNISMLKKNQKWKDKGKMQSTKFNYTFSSIGPYPAKT